MKTARRVLYSVMDAVLFALFFALLIGSVGWFFALLLMGQSLFLKIALVGAVIGTVIGFLQGMYTDPDHRRELLGNFYGMIDEVIEITGNVFEHSSGGGVLVVFILICVAIARWLL